MIDVMLVAIILLYAGGLLIDFRRHVKGAQMGEKALYIILMTIGCTVLFLHQLGIRFPSPAYPIERVVQTIFKVQ
ncbi:MAG: hypothetical protein ACOYI5_10265 [Christensenellales bacterium]|jgi:hypothetical protein